MKDVEYLNALIEFWIFHLLDLRSLSVRSFISWSFALFCIFHGVNSKKLLAWALSQWKNGRLAKMIAETLELQIASVNNVWFASWFHAVGQGLNLEVFLSPSRELPECFRGECGLCLAAFVFVKRHRPSSLPRQTWSRWIRGTKCKSPSHWSQQWKLSINRIRGRGGWGALMTKGSREMIVCPTTALDSGARLTSHWLGNWKCNRVSKESADNIYLPHEKRRHRLLG